MPTSRNIFVLDYMSLDIFKLGIIDEVDEYGFSKLTQLTSKKHLQVQNLTTLKPNIDN